jgi:hypothetical protein
MLQTTKVNGRYNNDIKYRKERKRENSYMLMRRGSIYHKKNRKKKIFQIPTYEEKRTRK